MNTGFLRHAVATVLTVYGIETILLLTQRHEYRNVATVLTVYGIETNEKSQHYMTPLHEGLQQCLPFTVLKQKGN